MLNRNVLILAFALWSAVATAQVPVVEAGTRRNQNAAAPEAGGGNELVLSLYNQLEALQSEVQSLRGMVEEQANQIRRLQTQETDHYIDIDRRLSELSGAAPMAPGLTPNATLPGATPDTLTPPTAAGTFPPLNDTNPQVGAPAGRNPSVGGAPAVTNPTTAGVQTADTGMNENDLYRSALNLLLEQNQPEQSIQLFQSYIDRFPQGRLLTNAYYWQGEALILVERFDQARDVFTRLVTNYPEDPKAAGAMLKLGIVYDRMGNRALAEQTWREIGTRYPENATEIREAQSRLSGQ